MRGPSLCQTAADFHEALGELVCKLGLLRSRLRLTVQRLSGKSYRECVDTVWHASSPQVIQSLHENLAEMGMRFPAFEKRHSFDSLLTLLNQLDELQENQDLLLGGRWMAEQHPYPSYSSIFQRPDQQPVVRVFDRVYLDGLAERIDFIDAELQAIHDSAVEFRRGDPQGVEEIR